MTVSNHLHSPKVYFAKWILDIILPVVTLLMINGYKQTVSLISSSPRFKGVAGRFGSAPLFSCRYLKTNKAYHLGLRNLAINELRLLTLNLAKYTIFDKCNFFDYGGSTMEIQIIPRSVNIQKIPATSVQG